MQGVKEGSTAAFAVLYDRYSARAFRVVRAVCRDEDRAQDALQETFLSIWNSRATYVDRGNVAPWVLRVARNRAVDVERRNGRHARHRAGAGLEDTLSCRVDVCEGVIAQARVRDLLSALDHLPEPQREVLVLAFHGQLTHAEIAECLDVPLGTVKGRIRLGLGHLRLILRDGWRDPEA